MISKEPTDLEQLIFHLDRASSAAFRLKNDTELGMDMSKLSQRLDNYLNEIMEYNDETHISPDNY